jgi:hypothetical protein
MSAYKKIECDIVDKDSLLEALTLLNLSFQDHEIPQNLYGWKDDQRNEKANIIINRKEVNKYTGASNDIGFLWNGEKYEMVISEYDKKFNMDKRFIQAYVKVVLEKSLLKNGFKIKVNIDEDQLRQRQIADLDIVARKII